MTSIFAKTAIVALVGIGSIVTVPAAASANDFGIYFGFGGPGYHHRFDDRDFDRRDRGICRNRHALRKAARIGGLHRTYVAFRNRHRVVVEGRRHHHRERIVFANNRHCSIIRW